MKINMFNVLLQKIIHASFGILPVLLIAVVCVFCLCSASGADPAPKDFWKSAENAISSGDFESARNELEPLAAAADDSAASARACFLLGQIAYHRGTPAMHGQLSHPKLQVPVPGLYHIGDSNRGRNYPVGVDYNREGDYEQAREYYQRALDNQHATLMVRQAAAFFLAHSYYKQDRLDEAFGAYAAALDHLQDPVVAPSANRFRARQYRGHILLHRHDWRGARREYILALDLYASPTMFRDAMADIDFAWQSQLMQALADLRLGKTNEAVTALETFLSDANSESQPEVMRDDYMRSYLPVAEKRIGPRRRDVQEAHVCLGQARLALGEHEAARTHLSAALACPAPMRAYDLEAEARLEMARLEILEDRTDKAAGYLRALLEQPLTPAVIANIAIELWQSLSQSPAPQAAIVYGMRRGGDRPVGGATNRVPVKSKRLLRVETAAELKTIMEQLAQEEFQARRGVVVHVPGENILDMEQIAPLNVPAGVHLAGDRGVAGSGGTELRLPAGHAGPILVMEEASILSGLRLNGGGPVISEEWPEWPDDYGVPPREETGPGPIGQRAGFVTALQAVRVPGSDVVIEHNLFRGFNRGVSVTGTDGAVKWNTFRDVVQYPVMASGSGCLIEGNIIEWIWHAVANSHNMRASYEMRDNLLIELVPNFAGQGISQVFAVDTHGNTARVLVHHNTFDVSRPLSWSVPNRAVGTCPLRDEGLFTHNWVVRPGIREEWVGWQQQRINESLRTPLKIATFRDMPAFLLEWIEHHPEYADPIELTVGTRTVGGRVGEGGKNMGVIDNAYGVKRAVRSVTILTSPGVRWLRPEHRQVRTLLPGGRGGEHNPPLRLYSGVVPLDVDISAPPELQPLHVRMILYVPEFTFIRPWWNPRREPDPQWTLHDATHVPPPGEVLVDTTQYPNGIYGVRVEVTDKRGIKTFSSTFIKIKNSAKSVDK